MGFQKKDNWQPGWTGWLLSLLWGNIIGTVADISKRLLLNVLTKLRGEDLLYPPLEEVWWPKACAPGNRLENAPSICANLLEMSVNKLSSSTSSDTPNWTSKAPPPVTRSQRSLHLEAHRHLENRKPLLLSHKQGRTQQNEKRLWLFVSHYGFVATAWDPLFPAFADLLWQ